MPVPKVGTTQPAPLPSSTAATMAGVQQNPLTEEDDVKDTMALEVPQQSARITGNITGMSDAGPIERMVGTALEGPARLARATGLEGAMYGFTELLATVGDVPLNLGIAAAEKAGIVDEGVLNRDNLQRIFTAGDYETAERLAPFIFYGKGQEVGSDANTMDRYGRAVGEFAGIGNLTGQALKGYSALTAGPGQLVDDLGVNITRIADAERRLAAPLPATEGGNVATRTISDLSNRAGRLAEEKIAKTRLTEQMMAPYRANPQTAMAIEMGMGGISGVGFQAEEDIFGTQSGAGALAPFALWYVMPSRYAANSYKWLKEKVVTGS